MEETVPGEVGYASPWDLGIWTVLFETTAMLSRHTGRARDSMQALWSRLKEGGKQMPKMSWDLEEGRRSISEVAVEDLPHSENLSLVLSIPTLVTLYGPTPPSPLSDLVWSSPASSNLDTTSCLSPKSTGSIFEPQHMVVLQIRIKKANAGNILSLTRDVAPPSCEFIHCSCEVCLTFRKDARTWQPAVSRTVAWCKCPRCRRHYDSTGHWDPTRVASAQLYLDMVGFNVSVSCEQGPLDAAIRTTHPSRQPVPMGPVTQPSRHRHREQYHNRRTQQALIRPPIVSALQPVLASSAKLHTPVAQHTALVSGYPNTLTVTHLCWLPL